ncbi:MAG TPA: DUF4397 domain-containing protein [Terriglobales bacterium]
MKAELLFGDSEFSSAAFRGLQAFTNLNHSLLSFNNFLQRAQHQFRSSQKTLKELFVIRVRKAAPVSLCVIIGIIAITAGCGSGNTQVRLMNAMDGQSSVNMLLDNTSVASGVTFGAASAYTSTSSGSPTLEVQASGGSTLLNQSITLKSGSNNTILATDAGATVLADNKTMPSSGNIQIRVVNASNALGTADVYVITPGSDISAMNPTVAGLAFRSASSYQTVAAGSYEVVFTQSGSKNAIISSNALSFGAGQIRTVASLDGNGIFSIAVLSDLN